MNWIDFWKAGWQKRAQDMNNSRPIFIHNALGGDLVGLCLITITYLNTNKCKRWAWWSQIKFHIYWETISILAHEWMSKIKNIHQQESNKLGYISITNTHNHWAILNWYCEGIICIIYARKAAWLKMAIVLLRNRGRAGWPQKSLRAAVWMCQTYSPPNLGWILRNA